MSSEIITILVIGIVTLFGAMALYGRFKESAFEMWKHDFEQELGFSPSDEAIRDLYDTSTSPKEAALIYKEIMENKKTEWLNQN